MRLAPAATTTALALALAAPAAALTACTDDGDDATAAATAGALDLDGLKLVVHDRATRDFTADGTTYTLLRLEYGETEDCDGFGDCSYSVYCGFIVDKKHYPLEVTWNSDADALFDPATYCEDGELAGCELPGQTLPILDDEDFEAWVYDTDPADDVLVTCFDDYW